MPTSVLPDREIALLTVDAYLRAAEDGAWGPDPRIELIEGVVYRMSPKSRRHERLVARLILEFANARPALPIEPTPGSTLKLDEHTAVEPDFIVWPGHLHAQMQDCAVGDILLVVEIALNTLTRDRDEKAALYAAAGIREYWVVDPAAKRIVVHRNPVASERRYALTIELSGSEAAVPAALPEVRVVPETLFA